MKKFHISIGVNDIAASVSDYSARLGQDPEVLIDGEYALWRTETLNFSIRKTNNQDGVFRHIGWEDETADAFTEEKDCNGILWERFNRNAQLDEIKTAWPDQ